MASPHSTLFRRINCYVGSGTAAVMADVPGYRPGELPRDAQVALRGHMAFTRVIAPAVIRGWELMAGERFAAALAEALKLMEEKVAAACAPPTADFSMKPRKPTPEEAAAITAALERSGL